MLWSKGLRKVSNKTFRVVYNLVACMQSSILVGIEAHPCCKGRKLLMPTKQLWGTWRRRKWLGRRQDELCGLKSHLQLLKFKRRFWYSSIGSIQILHRKMLLCKQLHHQPQRFSILNYLWVLFTFIRNTIKQQVHQQRIWKIMKDIVQVSLSIWVRKEKKSYKAMRRSPFRQQQAKLFTYLRSSFKSCHHQLMPSFSKIVKLLVLRLLKEVDKIHINLLYQLKKNHRLYYLYLACSLQRFSFWDIPLRRQHLHICPY